MFPGPLPPPFDLPSGSVPPIGGGYLADKTQHRLGVIVHGATSGLVAQQHLPALLGIWRDGGVPLSDGSRLWPELLLVGRDPARVANVAADVGLKQWTTDLDAALSSADHAIFFDAAASGGRGDRLRRALAAGKHVYTEKPLAGTVAEAMELMALAGKAGLRNGVVQDKLYLPGFRKLKLLCDANYFGRILELRLEFSRWIFDGETQAAQRPSWNYRKADGGGLVLDMFPHWRYMIEALAGEIRAVNCICRTHIPRRRDEHGQSYDVDVEDAAFAQLELEGGVIASVNSSWCSRIRRDGIINIQIDGNLGSAVASPSDCFTQSDAATPGPTISGRRPKGPSFMEQWLPVPDSGPDANGYRAGWELFFRHVAEGSPFPASFVEGAKGVQLAELGYRSHHERRWVDIPPLCSP